MANMTEEFKMLRQFSLVPSLHEAELASTPQVVCVTGVSGYVAGHIVQRLLAAGHTVHGTVRSLDKKDTYAHILSMQGAKERLHLFQADLLGPSHAWSDALRGCTALMHVASSYRLDVACMQKEERCQLVETAVEGTRKVLEAAKEAGSVKKVVLTSSTAAVWADPYAHGKDTVLDEEHWNTVTEQEGAEDGALAYFYAKTRAEQVASELLDNSRNLEPAAASSTMIKPQGADESGSGVVGDKGAGSMVLVRICPPAVWGPPLSACQRGSESVCQMQQITGGLMWPFAPPLGSGFVDVRDVALAHCLALVQPSAQGRYLINAKSLYPALFAAKVLKQRLPQHSKRWWLPHGPAPRWACAWVGPWLGLPAALTAAMHGKRPRVCVDKASRELGLETYIAPEDTVVDMAKAMLKLGLLA